MRDYIEQLRGRLERRVQRTHQANPQVYHTVLVQFWNFLVGEPLLLSLLTMLRGKFPMASRDAEKLVRGEFAAVGYPDETEHAAYAASVILECARSGRSDIEQQIGSKHTDYTPASRGETIPSTTAGFTTHFVEPLGIYLAEHLDSNQMIQTLLVRYKQKVEWFQREGLMQIYQHNARGEGALLSHLLEYLHDQGLDVSLEPASASGRVDLVSVGKGLESFAADGKVFDGKSLVYIARGFRQLYHYTCDFNLSAGYLIIYKVVDGELHLALPITNSLQFIHHNNKTLFVLVIDIYEHQGSASKRPKMKRWELSSEELFSVLTKDANAEVGLQTISPNG